MSFTSVNEDLTHRGLARTYNVLSEHGLVRVAGSWTSAYGEWVEFEINCFVSVVANGQLQRTESFEVDRLEEAIQRFRSLTSAPPV